MHWKESQGTLGFPFSWTTSDVEGQRKVLHHPKAAERGCLSQKGRVTHTRMPFIEPVHLAQKCGPSILTSTDLAILGWNRETYQCLLKYPQQFNERLLPGCAGPMTRRSIDIMVHGSCTTCPQLWTSWFMISVNLIVYHLYELHGLWRTSWFMTFMDLIVHDVRGPHGSWSP